MTDACAKWWAMQTQVRAVAINDRVQITAGTHWAREGTLIEIKDGMAIVQLDKPVKGKRCISVPVNDIRTVDVGFY